MLLAVTLAAGLVPAPSIQQAVAAAANGGTLSITHSPVGGTFAKGTSVYLYSQAFSAARNLLSYQWYRNTSNSTSGGAPVSGATGANLVDDSAKSLDAGTYYYYVEVADAKTGEKAVSATAAVKIVDKGSDIAASLRNGDFEQKTAYWNTTHTNKAIEARLSAKSYGLSASGHGIVAELAADYASSLYQEVAATPGSVYRWGLYHAGRNKNLDEAALIVGPALDQPWEDAGSGSSDAFPYGESISNRNWTYFNAIVNQVVAEQGLGSKSELAGREFLTEFHGGTYYIFGLKDGDWGYYSGSYTVPENQGLTVFAFVDTRASSGAYGNIFDAISFAQGSPIEASSDVDSQGNGILSATAADGYAYGLLEVRGSTVTQVSNFQAMKGETVLAEDATVAAAGGQGWYVPGAGTIRFTNLTPGKTYRIVQVPVNAIGGIMNQNLTPASVLDESCYDDFAVKPVSGGSGSSIGNIQVTARNEADGTSSLIVDPARDDVEYGVVAANATGDGPADPVSVVKEWVSSDTGKLVITGLTPNTSYVVVGRPKGYTEIEYGPASASGTIIKTPSAAFKDVQPADVERSSDGETLTVTNHATARQEYMVYDVETKVAQGQGWYALDPNGSQSFAVTGNSQYQIVTRSEGAVPAPGLRSYPAPLETLAIDYVNEVVPKGATMPKTLQYRAQDANNGETWRYGSADAWLDGTGGANVPLADALNDMSRLEEETGTESAGATFWYRTKPSFDPATAVDKSLAIPARPEAPAQGTASAHDGAGFWIDYATDELVVGASDVQFRRAGASSWTRYTAGTRIGLPLIGWTEKDDFAFELRTAAVDSGDASTSAFASETVQSTAPQRAEGPTAEGQPEVKGSKDGENLRLLNVTTDMEYRVWGSGDAWTRITDAQLKTAPDGTTRYVDVPTDGTYEVRAAATDDAPASFSVTASTTDSALSLETLVRSFSQQDWGYNPAPEQEIVIKNTGTADAVIDSIALGKSGSSSFAVTGETAGTVAAGTTDKTRKVSPVLGLAPGVYEDKVIVKYHSSTGGTSYTAAVPVYVQVRQASQAPPRDITATVTDTELTVSATVPAGYALADPRMQFSVDGGITWTDPLAVTGEGDERAATWIFTGLNAATTYTVLARMAADDAGYKLESEETVARFYTAKAAPAASRMIIDYVHETVSYPTGHEAASSAAGAGDAIARGGSITDYLSGDATVFSLRQTSSTDLSQLEIPASAWTDVDIPARPAAPTGLTSTPADSSKAQNGSITVPGAAAIEYRKTGDAAWVPTGGIASGLGAGTYEVRLAATGTSFASLSATIDVEATKEVFVTFMMNDGSVGEAAVFGTPQTLAPGAKATAPATSPTRDNYQFAGWYESADGGATLAASPFDFATVISADTTLYAKWTANSYALSFDTAGGSAAPAGQTVAYDAKVTAPAEPTRTGYTFAGWALSGRAADNTAVFDFEKTLAENFTAAGATPPQNNEGVALTAQWTALAYSVSFDAATGDAADDPAAPGDVAYDAYATADKGAPKPEPKREGYEFDGWHLEKSDGTLVEADYLFTKTLGENLTSSSMVPDDPTTAIVIKASWIERTYTLTFDPAGGTPSSVGQDSVKYTAKAAEPVAVKRAGYTFDGWRLVTGGTADAPTLSDVSFDFAKSLADNLTAAGVTAPGAGQEQKVELRAAWSANAYDVLFDADGDGLASTGEALKSAVAFDAAVPDASAVPQAERAGWTFTHWKLAGAEDAKQFDPAATLSANFQVAGLAPAEDATQVVIVPVFTENAYTLFFDADADGAFDASSGDTQVEGVSYTAALENASAVAVPQKTGYTFGAWHLVNAEGAALDAGFALDATVQANFEAAGTTPPKTTASTVRLVPSFAAKSYAVAFDLDGDGAVDADETSVTGVAYDAVGADSPLAKPADPERPGYLFQNWAISGATGNAVYDFALSLEANCTAASFAPTASADTILLAPVWKPYGYSVTFDARGGAPTPTGPAASVPTNGTVSAPTGDGPSLPGYAFADWRLRVGGTDAEPVLAEVVYDFTLTLEANFQKAGFDLVGGDATKPAVPDDGTSVVLYAAWTPNDYTLLFDANASGSAETGEATAAVNADGTTSAPADPARPGYTFAGTWHLADRASGSTATYDFGASLIDNLAAAGFDTGASGTGTAVPAANSQIALVPDWTENSYTLSFTANPTDDPDDVAGTYPPDDIVIANPSNAGPVKFEASAADVTMPQVECTGYQFTGWRFAGATDKDSRYDTTKSFKENLAAAGFDTGLGTGTALPGTGSTLELVAVWAQIPIKVEVPTTLMAQIGFDTNNPDVRTVTVNPDLNPDDGQPAAPVQVRSYTPAPLQMTSVEVSAGADLATLFPKGLHAGADAVTMSLNGMSIFNGATLTEDGASTLLPQKTVLPKEGFSIAESNYPLETAPALDVDFGLAAPMSIEMAQIVDPLSAASFLNVSYAFAIVPAQTPAGGE